MSHQITPPDEQDAEAGGPVDVDVAVPPGLHFDINAAVARIQEAVTSLGQLYDGVNAMGAATMTWYGPPGSQRRRMVESTPLYRAMMRAAADMQAAVTATQEQAGTALRDYLKVLEDLTRLSTAVDATKPADVGVTINTER